MDDDFGHDADLVALVESAERAGGASASTSSGASRSVAGAGAASTSASAAGTGVSNSGGAGSKIVQPTPRALPQRNAPSAIIVSTRQKGNPLLTHITALPWEYGDIAADYIIGATACALFLSLKYHRLHPEYIYSRIRVLGHKYRLRVLLVTVDIDNHEEPLRELAKTSLVNDFTLMIAWSAREAARYLESYKMLEHAAPAAIRGSKPARYLEQMVEFVTTPRGINKTDAVALVSNFGSLRAAANAPPEALAGLQGWGEVKVSRWHRTLREPFRATQAKERRTAMETDADAFVPASRVGPAERAQVNARRDVGRERNSTRQEPDFDEPGDDEEEALRQVMMAGGPADDAEQTSQTQTPTQTNKRSRAAAEPELDAGIAAALAKYRKS